MKLIWLLSALSVCAPALLFANVGAIVEDGKNVGVESRDTQGNVQWTVRHRVTEKIHELNGPLNLNGKWVYAIGGDVLTLSDDGKVVARTQYPALISDLRSPPERGHLRSACMWIEPIFFWIASLVSPNFSWMIPYSLSADPSAFWKSSSINSPQAFFARPFNCSNFPST